MVGVRRERTTRRVSPRRGAAAGRRRGAGERSARRRGGGGDGRARGARGARGRRPGGAEARARGGVPMIDHRASRRTSTAHRPHSRAPRGCAPRRPASTRGRRGRARSPRRGPSARSPWTSGRASRARASRRARPRARARASAHTSTKRSACRVMRLLFAVDQQMLASEPPGRTAATRDDRDLARAADLNVRSVAVFPSARPQQSRSLHASRISRPRRAPRLVRDGLRDVRRRG